MKTDAISKYDPTVLYHHGIKGQKWGVRRFQNKDGTYTEAGKRRMAKDLQKRLNKAEARTAQLYAGTNAQREATRHAAKEYEKAMRKGNEEKAKKWMERALSSNKRMEDLDRKYYESVVETSKLMKRVKNDPNFVTYYKRDATGPVDRKDNRAYKKKNGKYYYTDTVNTPTEVYYDKTKVKVANERNRKKASRKRQTRKDYQLSRTEIYYY